MARSPPQTCLNTQPHDDRVSDPVLHYFGCLPKSRKAKFFATLPSNAQRRIKDEEGRIARLRVRLQARPDSDAAARLAQFQASMGEYRRLRGWDQAQDGCNEDHEALQDDGIATLLKAPVVCFKDGKPHEIPNVPGTWPHQKLRISELLEDDHQRNPLMQPCEDGMVRYFHLPANNMAWVEEAMARYYHESRPGHDDLFMNSKLGRKRTRTEMLLRTECWQGQQNFGEHSEVHARHMRPLCNAVSINPVFNEPSPKNAVLFMPYLHWETNRGRHNSAEIIKDAMKDKLSSIAQVVNEAQNRLSKTQEVNHDMAITQLQHLQQLRPVPIDSSLEASRRRKLLGDVLRQAAHLLEAMEFYPEEQLVREYLYHQPPLHPRRTLDQSYYGALKNTDSRDRDQVVYRATTPEPHECYEHLDETTGKCGQCELDVRKVPRLIMVDQLWLWILDEKTVISAFPRRFGKNKPDPSAIHKSLRVRFKCARSGEINTAYDLALIIMDECSRVFFDRTRISHRVPNLTDMFADAIREVTFLQTAAFDQFLIYTHLASREFKRDLESDLSTQNTLLNINPEGNLLKEIKDIMDELHIILRIKAQQQIVMESFVKHVRTALVPAAHLAENVRVVHGARGSRNFDASPEGYFADVTGQDTALDSEARKRSDRARWTLNRADQLLLDIKDRILDLETLMENATGTSNHLKDLLTLKQQQAGVIEAREACKQAAETLKQGRSIMLFTVITIIFLPLSFCATIYGMNTWEWQEAPLTLRDELTYMFSISAGIIAISFLLAFSRSALNNSFTHLIGNAWSLGFNTFTTWLSVKSGMFMLGRSLAVKANALKDHEYKITGQMKANVMREKNNLEKVRAMQKITGIEPSKGEDDGSSTSTARGTILGKFITRPTGLTFPSTPGLLTPRTTGLSDSPASPFTSNATSPFFRGIRSLSGNMSDVDDVELGQRSAGLAQRKDGS